MKLFLSIFSSLFYLALSTIILFIPLTFPLHFHHIYYHHPLRPKVALISFALSFFRANQSAPIVCRCLHFLRHSLISHKLPERISSSSASSLCLDMVDIIRLAGRLLSIDIIALLQTCIHTTHV